jgi:hypothetical protein
MHTLVAPHAAATPYFGLSCEAALHELADSLYQAVAAWLI